MLNKTTLVLRSQAIEKLGGKCVKCGVTDERILEIDHINGYGWEERRYLHYHDILRKATLDPTPYQLLCCNCHKIKTLETGDLNRKNRIMRSGIPLDLANFLDLCRRQKPVRRRGRSRKAHQSRKELEIKCLELSPEMEAEGWEYTP